MAAAVSKPNAPPIQQHSKEVQEWKNLLVQQQADHQGDLEKRDLLIEQLKGLFAEVEEKQVAAQK